MSVIAEIGGKKWVLGMHWQSYDDAPARSQLLEDSDELDAPWYSLRKTESVIQVGYCPPIAEIKRPRKLASLAAMLADVRPQPWLGVFEIAPELFWYIAVRDEYAILPTGDVVGTKTDIDAACSEHAGYGEWTVERGDMSVLEGLLSECEAKRTVVKSLAVSRIDPIPTAIGAAVAIFLGGATAVGHHFHAQEVLEQKRKLLMEAHARNVGQPRTPTAQELLKRTPEPSHWLATCFSDLSAMPASDQGWILTNRGCSSAGVIGKWLRGPGATVSEAPNGQIDPAGETITSMTPFSTKPANGKDTSTDPQTARTAMLAWSQRYGIHTEIGAPAPLSINEPVGLRIPVTIRMPMSPFNTDHGLDTIPGLRIERLDFSPAKGDLNSNEEASPVWQLEGTIYAPQ